MSIRAVTIYCILLFLPFAAFSQGHIESMQRYQQEAGLPFDIERGRTLWEKKVDGKSCVNCHNVDVTKPGKVGFWVFKFDLPPMALSVNPKLFEDPDNTEKQLNKRCDKVLGRLCTAQEKGDIIKYLSAQ